MSPLSSSGTLPRGRGRSLVFYISGHGFGHASRTIEVVNAVARLSPLRLIVRTSTPAWFIARSALPALTHHEVETDTGVVQIDSLTPDEHATARCAAAFYAELDRRVAAEAEVLRELDAAAVIGDIPPLAFAAAADAGVPSVALGNFTWDWIYAAYPSFERHAPGVIARVRAAYARATLALRLPLHGGFETTPVVEDIPLIARRSRRDRREVRALLDVPERDLVALASFGGFKLALPYDAIARRNGLTILVTDHEAGPGDDAGGLLRRISTQTLAARGLRYEDLVAAADVVVSKPGYGIVSECIANGTPLLYTSRGPFAEQDVFLREMPRLLRCAHLPTADLVAGRWRDGILRLLEQPAPAARVDTSGAHIAARRILEVAGERPD